MVLPRCRDVLGLSQKKGLLLQRTLPTPSAGEPGGGYPGGTQSLGAGARAGTGRLRCLWSRQKYCGSVWVEVGGGRFRGLEQAASQKQYEKQPGSERATSEKQHKHNTGRGSTDHMNMRIPESILDIECI